MPRARRCTIVFSTLAACVAAAHLTTPAAAADLSQIDRQILVALPQKPGANKSFARRKPYQRSYRRGASSVNRSQLNRIAREYAIERVDGWLISSLDMYCEVFTVPSEVSVPAVLEELNRDSRVQLAQPVNLFRTLAREYNDPYFSMQAAAQQLQLALAHNWSTGAEVSIAIIDSGADEQHPELAARISSQHDFVSDDRSFAEIHGTAVAGIIASAVNNGQGIVGVAPDAKLTILRACWQETEHSSTALCSSFTLAQALEFAMELQPDVINLSLTGPEDPLLRQLVDTAIARKTIIVTAMPDVPDHAGSFPASVPGVIVAQAPGVHRIVHTSSQIHAPGDQIITTVPDNGYALLSGNSLAAAHVTGVIALLLQLRRELTTPQLIAYLNSSVAHGTSASINACRALSSLQPDLSCEARTTGL